MSWLSSLTSDLTTTISSAVEEVVQHLPSASDLSPDGLEDENDPKEKDDQETAGREKGKQEKPSGDSLPLSSAMSSFFDTSIVSNFKPSDIVQSIDAIAASVVAPLASDHKNITLEQNRTARKEHEFDRMLPWETDEEEKEILCPEVREVILKFGSSRTVFEGPFRMSSGAMCIAEEADEKQDGEEEVVFQEEEKVIDEVDAILKDTTKEKDEKEIEELYFPFDLDSHLGLIRRMMEIDEHLVAAHSKWCSK
uniref:Uncharacterized protein n=1 Tax=Corethron hystrix TaxID=216773 RepID=A0A6U5JGA1_9STRA|mmetsp:Transcript_37190/g.86715  ORF Transcript_37190/g.86715 Transcript_37190/m.86715 type:complete len:252 (+) Transcript_37190:199-954(+)